MNKLGYMLGLSTYCCVVYEMLTTQRCCVRSTNRLRWDALFVLLLLFLAGSASSWASGRSGDDDEFVFSVYFGAGHLFLVNPDSDGRQLGDLRVGAIDTEFASGDHAGDLNATMVTTSVDVPELGDEVRMVTLAFRFREGRDQIVVEGATSFVGAEPTIDLNQSTIRPITGGSGKFAGAGGWSETIHLADGTWKNTFHLLIPERKHGRERRHRRRH